MIKNLFSYAIVAINKFTTDTDKEIEFLSKKAPDQLEYYLKE